ncbi:TrbI/VirB10 family protein [uncultured Sphingomonas sp.]|uniref:TrbI/VirB10 family protein n=1 Tax=uncultured Sphingomonas sp. TaxID=158754 RepID=UPI0025E2008E|nr:TrbI/VirB10 family protein [uncultured Sphingomonas sp.]
MTVPSNDSASNSLRPLVAGAAGRRSLWMGIAVLGLVGAGLFAMLESRRNAQQEPALGARLGAVEGASSTARSDFPPLTLPQADPEPPMPQPISVGPAAAAFTAPALPPAPHPVPAAVPPAAYVMPVPAPAVGMGKQAGVYDGARQHVDVPGTGNANADRVLAVPFANPSSTVPKGAVIQAVLESALDSTRVGMVRAIVSRDVHGFDGTHVVVPRGSRLIGEYKTDQAAGQARALIQWQRLMRPDGATIALESPAADPLGRAGVAGKVHSHFWARLGGALLQSTINVGNQVAVNDLSKTGVYVLPGVGSYPATAGAAASGGALIPQITTTVPQPSLTVPAGTSVSVFVARDLDFSEVGP